jgi:hypothetical protein
LFPNRNGDGLAIWSKRLEMGSFHLPTDLKSAGDVAGVEITAEELSLLFDGIDLRRVSRRQRFSLPKKLNDDVFFCRIVSKKMSLRDVLQT